MTHTLHIGDCRDVLATMGDATVDSIVCDPPYELGFMGKAWDASGIAYDVTVWAQCLRVLKPGGHLIAFGGSRTYHRLAVAIEDAGFEIRDQIQWIYGSGFPKSLDVSKAMDKQAGAVRTDGAREWQGGQRSGGILGTNHGTQTLTKYDAPSTDLAKQWHGWGTALKPAHEPAVLARKPLRGTVADTVAQWRTGALNIEGTRVGGDGGRWPSNVILDEEAALVLDGQSGRSKCAKPNPSIPYGQCVRTETNIVFNKGLSRNIPGVAPYGDSGGASRFFYVAKASKAEREAGLHYEEWHKAGVMQGRQDGSLGAITSPRANHHPTVKPLALMRYLVRMVTPPGGVVLDPFMGSGSTGCAAVREGFDFVGIDLTPEYVAIAQKRIDWHAVTSPLDNVATMELHEENDA
jgi:site-specific DNA-methyltransferase (adenine-specific)